MSDAQDKLTIRRHITVARTAPQVWSFVRDMGNWASLMPGYISHESLSEVDSVWMLQVDIGPFARPVAIDVHILRWEEPHHVSFEIKGKHDPFVGNGSFSSAASGDKTGISLEFRAEPTGSMARMLVPLVPPILRQVADHFAASLNDALDPGGMDAARQPPVPARPVRRFWSLLWSRLVGRTSN